MNSEEKRIIPESTLDYAAMHAAIDQFQLEAKQTEIREWLVYQAPPGVYELFLQERQRMIDEAKAEQRITSVFTGAFILFITVWAFWGLFNAGSHG